MKYMGSVSDESAYNNKDMVQSMREVKDLKSGRPSRIYSDEVVLAVKDPKFVSFKFGRTHLACWCRHLKEIVKVFNSRALAFSLFGILLLRHSPSQAIESGSCQAQDPAYSGILFKLESFSDSQEDFIKATELVERYKGQIITEQGGGAYHVIYHTQIKAPSVPYQCVKKMSAD